MQSRAAIPASARLAPSAKPLAVALLTLALLCVLRWLDAKQGGRGLSHRLELLAYDVRVRLAAKILHPPADSIAGVFIDDESLTKLNDGWLGERVSWPWPRSVYGRILHELTAQGTAAVGFDIFFDERRPLDPPVIEGGVTLASDSAFALELGKSKHTILAAESIGAMFPDPLFATNSAALGSVFAYRDADNIVRRARPYFDYLQWHPEVVYLARSLELDLESGVVGPAKIRFKSKKIGEEGFDLELNADGSLKADNLAAEYAAPQKPYQSRRLWHLGICLAAQALNLDLENPRIEPGRVVLSSPPGASPVVVRDLPLDEEGYFYIDWNLRLRDPRVPHERRQTALQVLVAGRQRAAGATNPPAPFRGKLVVIGSTGTGNNVSDLGATPLEDNSMLVAAHWNVAASLINNRRIRPYSAALELLLAIVFGLVACAAAWRLRVFAGVAVIAAIATTYLALAAMMFVQGGYWLPVVFPVAGGLLVPQTVMFTYRALSEQRAHRRVKAVFAKVVAPDVVSELLRTEKLSLGGARRRMTVFFSDVRGFTEFTDARQSRAEALARESSLVGEAAEVCFDREARETLETINLYLAIVAGVIKEYRGVLDKYIGDCVMAFWGAPIANPDHAADCVRAAIEVQRRIAALNREREAENQRRLAAHLESSRAASPRTGDRGPQTAVENLTHPQRVLRLEDSREGASGAKAAAAATTVTAELPVLLPLLQLGTGINTGDVIVGLMGSEAHISNFTVFGREVNLASRLEGLSGHARILIGEGTFKDLQEREPDLAALCIEQPSATVKGIRGPVRNYAVRWE